MYLGSPKEGPERVPFEGVGTPKKGCFGRWYPISLDLWVKRPPFLDVPTSTFRG